MVILKDTVDKMFPEKNNTPRTDLNDPIAQLDLHERHWTSSLLACYYTLNEMHVQYVDN